MLKIRQAQMDEFRKQSEQEFIEKVAQDIRENHADKVADISEEELRRRVEFGLEKAQKYEMTGKYPIALFIELMFIVAPDFYEYPLIHFTLQDKRISPNKRIDQAVKEMNEQRWENVKVRSDNEWKIEGKVN